MIYEEGRAAKKKDTIEFMNKNKVNCKTVTVEVTNLTEKKTSKGKTINKGFQSGTLIFETAFDLLRDLLEKGVKIRMLRVKVSGLIKYEDEDEKGKRITSYFDNLREAYKKGGIGDGRVKKFLFEVMNDTLTPFRERRKEIAKDIPKVIEILKQGTKHANELADETLKEVKQTMGIGYFYDDTFENEIIERYK